MQQIIVKDGDYNCPPQVTKQDWIDILSDDSFMSNNYKFALSIFYLEPEHKATCKYLAEKYHTHPTSISGFITQFSARLQGKLDRFEIIREDGSPNWWLVTMTGKKIAGGLFEWRLRDELIEAIFELNYVQKSMLQIHDIEALIKYVNNDIYDFATRFVKTRQHLADLKRPNSAKQFFTYESKDRDWAVNVGGSDEVQYRIYLRDGVVGYGLGFNTRYVESERRPNFEYIKPYMEAFISLRESDEITKLEDRGFSLDNDITDINDFEKGKYYLYGRQIKMNGKYLSLIDYYSIINDLKGGLFEVYKKVYELTNKLRVNSDEVAQDVQQPITSPLLQDISKLLLANKNLILTGAPGTGKTYLAKTLAEEWGAKYELIQFHPSYDYTDFVEGLRPIQNVNGEVGFELRDGSFKKFCKEALKYQNNQQLSNFEEVYQRFIDDISESSTDLTTPSRESPFSIIVNSRENITAVLSSETQRQITLTKPLIQNYLETGKSLRWKPYLTSVCDYIEESYDLRMSDTGDKSKKFIIILDEINRAEISKVLGELFFSIDPGYRGESGRVTTQYANLQTDEDVFKEGFYIPDNVYIIGTMNDIDRSVESFDFAMRRRFAWKEIKSADRLSMWEGQIDDWAEEAKQRLMDLNKAIESVQGLNSAYHVGPSYFLKLANYDGDFDKLWTYHLESLLFEYLRGYPDAEQQIQGLKDAYNLQLGFNDDRNDG
ncbi:McrB family protein [Psychrobacter sp. JCM 18900]|uniref:McrB family protein n=2 Tax=Psychrobacter sp. JCM 18900 TaxID=1298608 RepID=UPI00191AFE74|nr:AAA family ATPase [Psychrobacter sp. JCM 18900]